MRPDSWEPFYTLRESGMVPRRGFVRVTLGPNLTLGSSMEIPEGNPWRFDFSPVAGLDVFVIYDGDRTSYGRLSNAVGAILKADPSCVYLLDAPQGLEPRWACMKRAKLPGGSH